MPTKDDKNRAIHEWMIEGKDIHWSGAMFYPNYFTPQGFFEIKEKLVDGNNWLFWAKMYFHKSCHGNLEEEDFSGPNIDVNIRHLDYHHDNPDSLPNKLYEHIKGV